MNMKDYKKNIIYFKIIYYICNAKLKTLCFHKGNSLFFIYNATSNMLRLVGTYKYLVFMALYDKIIRFQFCRIKTAHELFIFCIFFVYL